MVNLIQNAIDAMQSVNDRRRELQVKTEHCGDDDSIKVTIADTGPGIDPGKSDAIFEAFFTTKPNGMGLGLAICRMIVERHGGQLSASSASPYGAIFQITLPRSDPALTDVASGSLQPKLGLLSGMATSFRSRSLLYSDRRAARQRAALPLQ
jgi:signal transduction histidine kinase